MSDKESLGIFGDPYSTPPFHVNEKGVKFWPDVECSRYAINKGLVGVQVLLVEEVSGRRTRIVTENQQPVYENQSLEGIGCHLDIMALHKERKDTP